MCVQQKACGSGIKERDNTDIEGVLARDEDLNDDKMHLSKVRTYIVCLAVKCV